MSRFERAYLITVLEEGGPSTAQEVWCCVEDRTERQVERDLERLVAEGVVVRTERPTYCSDCGSDSGVEYVYEVAR